MVLPVNSQRLEGTLQALRKHFPGVAEAAHLFKMGTAQESFQVGLLPIPLAISSQHSEVRNRDNACDREAGQALSAGPAWPEWCKSQHQTGWGTHTHCRIILNFLWRPTLFRVESFSPSYPFSHTHPIEILCCEKQLFIILSGNCCLEMDVHKC